MSFYASNLYIVVAIVVAIFYLQRQRKERRHGPEDGQSATRDSEGLRNLKKTFFPVYILVIGSEWIQNPYIYTIFKEEKRISEEIVTHLFITGFLAAAISALFIGSLASKYGQRYTALIFCILSSFSCLSMLSSCLPILFAGRILGGVATSMMTVVFESWVVCEFHKQNLDETGGLKDVFGMMTMVNGVVAVLAGLIAQEVTSFTQTKRAPFVCAVFLLVCGGDLMVRKWTENFGEPVENEKIEGNKSGKKTLAQLVLDKRLWALCLVMTFFEGSMSLWVFLNFPALEFAHEEGGHGDNIPFGIIFAVMMCSMILGSQFFIHYSSLPRSRWVVTSSKLLAFTLIISSFCFLIPTLFHDEAVTFWSFCIFEICCGIYFPTVAHLRERIIEDHVRAKVYSLLRIPLNLFVVIGLLMTKEGREHRENVFRLCSVGLLSAAFIPGLFITDE